MINDKKVIGFVCECNPFHKGHKILIKEAKKRGDIIIAIMSGSFVQRGEPAVYDKYKRTLLLLKNNVDLVIELPVEFILSSANIFANASVNILSSLGFVDEIIFGSESNNIEKLNNIAKLNIYMDTSNNKVFTKVKTENYGNYHTGQLNSILNKDSLNKNDKLNIKEILKIGINYPKAIEIYTGEKLLSNDILSVEYIRAINKLINKLNFFIIKRDKRYSATTERKKINKKISTNSFSDILNYCLLNNTNLINISGTNQDICNSINNIKYKNFDFDKKALSLKTKNRTLSNIKRIFLCIILNINKNLLKKQKNGSYISYIRILGIKKEATSLLKYIKIPFLMGYNKKSIDDFTKKFNANKITFESIKINEYATNLYNIISKNNRLETTEKFICY